MIEITAEVRAAIDRAVGDMELAGDEYIEPVDGLSTVRNAMAAVRPLCRGSAVPAISCSTASVPANRKRRRNRGSAWSVSSAGRRRDFKTFFAGCIANALLDRDVPVLFSGKKFREEGGQGDQSGGERDRE